MEKEFLHKELTYQIIGAAFEVQKTLGYGFLEKVYENALIQELQLRGIYAAAQHPIKVEYKGVEVGDYYADLLVEDKVILELKTAESINEAHLAQLTNYLRATRCEVGLLLNFGSEPEHKRRFFSNENK